MKTALVTGIILGHKNLGEFDKLIHLYSREFGKLRIIAKGARKITSRFTGHLETLNRCNASIYFGPKNIILTEINTTKNIKTIRNDLEKLINALKIAEITNRLVQDNQQLDRLNDLMEETLKQLSVSQKNRLITYSYLLKLLDKTGLIADSQNSIIEYIKSEPLNKIESLNLNSSQQKSLEQIITAILNRYLKSSDLVTFTTPLTFSNLSINTSNLSRSSKSNKK